MILTDTQIQDIFYRAGFRGMDLYAVTKICYCESSFNTNAHNTSGEDSIGLMQINVDVWKKYKYLDLFDPLINASVAYEIFTLAGNTFKDWTCARILNLVDPNGFNVAGVEIPKNITLGVGIVLMAGLLLYLN
jgi:hypothetical protein